MNEIEFLMYGIDEKIEVIIKDETIWASQKAISQLFGVGIPAISKHLKNIFESVELDERVVVSILENTTSEFIKYECEKVVCAKNAHTTKSKLL